MYKIFVNDEEVCTSRNFKIKEEFLNTSSVILNDVYPISWEEDKDYVSKFYIVEDYSRVNIFELQNNELVKLAFSGLLKNTGNISLNPREKKTVSFEVIDYKTLLSEGKNLDFVIKDKTILEAIQMVVEKIKDYGFEVGNIDIEDANEKIGAYSTLDQSPFDVFQYLSEISSSLWTTRNNGSNITYIDFFDIENLVRDSDISYNKEYFKENNVKDIHYSFSTNDYRNKQEVTSENVYGNSTLEEILYSNGYNSNYTTNQKIGFIKSISVDGYEATFVTESERKIGMTAEYYYEPNTNIFYKDDSLPIDLFGTKVVIKYIPIIKGREIAINIEESKRIEKNLNRNGMITRYEKRNDLLEQNQLNKVAQTYLKFKGKPEITLTIVTENKDILTIGHKTRFNIDEIPFLNVDYLVKSKISEVIQTGEEVNTFYTYELSSNFNAETNLNYFDNQRRKSKGNIEEGSFIDRNVDIVDKVNIIFKNLSIEEVEND